MNSENDDDAEVVAAPPPAQNEQKKPRNEGDDDMGMIEVGGEEESPRLDDTGGGESPPPLLPSPSKKSSSSFPEPPRWRFINEAKSTSGFSSVDAGMAVDGTSAEELVSKYSVPAWKTKLVAKKKNEEEAEIEHENENENEKAEKVLIVGRLDILEEDYESDIHIHPKVQHPFPKIDEKDVADDAGSIGRLQRNSQEAAEDDVEPHDTNENKKDDVDSDADADGDVENNLENNLENDLLKHILQIEAEEEAEVETKQISTEIQDGDKNKNDDPKRKRRRLVGALAMICLVFAAVIVIVFATLLNNDDDDDGPNEASKPTPTADVTAKVLDVDCPSGTTPFKLDLLADNFPADISFLVRDACKGHSVSTNKSTCPDGVDCFSEPGALRQIVDCLPSDGGYVLDIYDRSGDGLCCSNGRGGYNVTYDDVLVFESTGDFGLEERTFFGHRYKHGHAHRHASDCSSSDKTLQTTGTPTASPTEDPCPPGSSLFGLTLTTDNSPEQTSWTLKDFCTEEVVKECQLCYSQKGVSSEESICLPDESKFLFEITDSAGDGMESGMYSIQIGRRKIIDGNRDFGESARTIFGNILKKCEHHVPSMSQTFSPTIISTPTIQSSTEIALPKTVAPTEESCPTGTTLFRFTITTDNFPEQTSWTLRDFCTDDVIKKCQLCYSEKGVSSEESLCLSDESKFLFELTDSAGDGMESGMYSIQIGSREITDGVRDFGESVRTIFGNIVEECERHTTP